jgi:predicted nucleotidyltransferase component of viral defense system
VIPHGEILALRAEWGLRDDVIEKDYILGWLLAAIGSDPRLATHWVFKGGTCLRKCYYETYRFSEDLDFTVVDGGPETADELLPILDRISEWLRVEAGIEIEVSAGDIRRNRNRRGNATTVVRIGFRGPRNPPTLPKVKIDLTSDEVLASPTVKRPILHPYSDAHALTAQVTAYSISELLGEKIRALAERCRPRDLYDVINVYRHPDLIGDPAPVRQALSAKCAHAGIPVPDASAILTSQSRAELDQEWANMLAHQLPHLPPVAEYWSAVEALFAWLGGAPPAVLTRAETREQLVPDWTPPASMARWGRPLDLIRYAGSNRLRVDVDYRAETGRRGWRRVEPYAFRMTRDGHVLLIVVNDLGRTRSYRTDRIADVRVTDEVFVPRYFVEF